MGSKWTYERKLHDSAIKSGLWYLLHGDCRSSRSLWSIQWNEKFPSFFEDLQNFHNSLTNTNDEDLWNSSLIQFMKSEYHNPQKKKEYEAFMLDWDNKYPKWKDDIYDRNNEYIGLRINNEISNIKQMKL